MERLLEEISATNPASDSLGHRKSFAGLSETLASEIPTFMSRPLFRNSPVAIVHPHADVDVKKLCCSFSLLLHHCAHEGPGTRCSEPWGRTVWPWWHSPAPLRHQSCPKRSCFSRMPWWTELFNSVALPQVDRRRTFRESRKPWTRDVELHRLSSELCGTPPRSTPEY